MHLSNRQSQTILIVDDADDVRELMTIQLRLAGYRVIEACNGTEAVELARRECPALILMDINMPVMDGITATQILRQVQELCGMVIVAFSALSSGDNRQRALAAGCNGFVEKTQSIDQLASMVQRFLPAV